MHEVQKSAALREFFEAPLLRINRVKKIFFEIVLIMNVGTF